MSCHNSMLSPNRALRALTAQPHICNMRIKSTGDVQSRFNKGADYTSVCDGHFRILYEGFQDRERHFKRPFKLINNLNILLLVHLGMNHNDRLVIGTIMTTQSWHCSIHE